MNKRQHRVREAAAFLLQARPWRETSCLATLLSRDYGLIVGIAKGAKRPYSVMRPILSHFQPLLISWSGQAEVKTLTMVEVDGFFAMPAKAMMSAWYMNELLIRCLAKEDPHVGLFDEYVVALKGLCKGMSERFVLRRFEWFLLREIGYGLEGAVPDFYDEEKELALRQLLRTHLHEVLAHKELNTRKVMQDGMAYYPPSRIYK